MSSVDLNESSKNANWLRNMIARAQEGVAAAEFDVTTLHEAASELRKHQAWEYAFTEGEKNWARLVTEQIDPQYKRVEWINAVIQGYAVLRRQGRLGRISRHAAEQAVGYQALPLPQSNTLDPGPVTLGQTLVVPQTELPQPLNQTNSPSFTPTTEQIPPDLDSQSQVEKPDLSNEADLASALAANQENLSDFVTMMQLSWNNASAEDRQAFLQWLQYQNRPGANLVVRKSG